MRRRAHVGRRPTAIDCDEARQAVSARLDDERSSVSESSYDAHMASCRTCREFQSQVQSLRPLTRQLRLRVLKAPPDELVERVSSLREVGPPLHPSPRRTTRPYHSNWLRVTQWVAAGAPAAVAVPALALGAFVHPHIVGTHVPTPCTFYLLNHHVPFH